MYLWCAKCRGIMYYCPCGVLSLNVQHLGTKNDARPRHERDRILNRFYSKPVEHWIYIEVVLASLCDFDLAVYLMLFLCLSWFRRGVFYVHTRYFMLLVFALTFSCSVVVSRPQIKMCFSAQGCGHQHQRFTLIKYSLVQVICLYCLKTYVPSVKVRLHCASASTLLRQHLHQGWRCS